MPITGIQLAKMPARMGHARLGASRLGWYWPTVRVTINGVNRDASNVRVNGLSIRDELNGIPNTATLRVDGFVPSHGHAITIHLGDRREEDLVFSGTILSLTKVYDLLPTQLCYDLSCISHEWKLNARKVTARYLSTSATAIVLDLCANYASWVDTSGVQAGLDSLDEVTFTNEDFTDALDRLKDRIGGSWVLEDETLHFGTTLWPAGLSTAHAITEGAYHGLVAIAATTDLSQVRTRVLVEGGGSQAAVEVAPGETILPVEDPVWYDELLGGTVVSGPQRITYTDVVEGGSGALVGSTITPTNPPTVTRKTGSGLGTGNYQWAQTFTDATGETLPSPLSAILTLGGVITAPASAPTATKQFGGNLSAGTYKWKVTFADAAGGETDAGSSESAAVTLDDVAAPSAAPGVVSNGGNPGGSAPGSGLDLNATYSYKYTLVHVASGAETLPSPATNVHTTENVFAPDMWLTPTGWQAPPLGWTHNYYRTEGNGSTYKRAYSGSESSFRTRFPDGLATREVREDATLGATAPSASTAVYRSADLTGIPVSPDANVVSRKLYRTEANGSTFKLVTTIANNTATTYTDTTADASLGATIPSSNTTVLAQASLTNIAIGPSGTTSRKLYRTAANGSQLKLLATLADNTTTIYTDSTADASLGANVPTANTSGFIVQTGEVAAGATSILITSTAPFQATGGWAFLGSLPIRYTGFSSTALTGVPATGIGALTTTVRYGAEIIASPMLTGIPVSGAGSVQWAIAKGDEVNLLVTRNDTAAQAALAALMGGDGILEDFIQDRRLSQTEAEARGDARLLEVKDPEVRVTGTTRDKTVRSGRDWPVTLTNPAISGTFTIQRTTISEVEALQQTWPVRQVEASSRKFTLEQLLRLVKAA